MARGGEYEEFASGYGASLRGDPAAEAFAELRLVAATLMRVKAAHDPIGTCRSRSTPRVLARRPDARLDRPVALSARLFVAVTTTAGPPKCLP